MSEKKTSNNSFIIIVDKREQLPWQFTGYDVRLIYAILETGDYSIFGLQNNVCAERKSLSDLFGSLGKGHKVFMDRMKRMRDFECKALVIEATYDRVLHPYKNYSKVHPSSVIGSLSKIAAVYNIPVIFAGGRRNAQSFVYHMFRHYRESKFKVEVKSDPTIKRTFSPI